ncbi:MAG: hypothetical protein PVI53_04800 [Desulfobacteraceae bacterium]
MGRRSSLINKRLPLGREPFGSEPFDALRVSSRVEKLKAERLRPRPWQGLEMTTRMMVHKDSYKMCMNPYQDRI